MECLYWKQLVPALVLHPENAYLILIDNLFFEREPGVVVSQVVGEGVQ